MKTCPQCQTSYTDDTLQYCLQDGTPLVVPSPSQAGNWGESETLVSPRQPEQIRIDLPTRQPTYSSNATDGGFNRETVSAEEPRKSKTGLIVVLSVLLTLLVVGLAGVGAYMYFRKTPNDVVVNVNTKPPINAITPNVAQNSNINVTNTPNLNTNQNVNTPTPTPKPTLNPKQLDDIKSNVKDIVKDWNDALEDHNLEDHLSNYAPNVDYYRSGSTGIGKIRADKQRAFETYNNINISIDNLNITPDPSGEKATAIFDKEWTFENDEKTSSGKVQQQLQLIKINGKWRITGEKDLKVYYVNN